MGENIEIIRRPGVQGFRNVQIVRRAAPKYLTFEVFNPETDDLDSESSCASSSASSPSSACSVISMASDWPSAQEIQELDREIEQQQRDRLSERETANGAAPAAAGALAESGPGPASASHLAAPSETDDSLSSSPEPPARLSSPRGRRKVTMARLDAPPLEQEEGPGSRQASSEESLPSDVGGALGHHRYYHVFREGELDRLIEKYVDNLHIISSYYDHANWCVVAEKVQVWTI
ncbi:probable tRNA methyltransferase 9B [Pollicipes pollicipes]|uniref:probable tRNA methyltransferase 9B n=1 Tax=Pollicipes pollicipes TaxID=41117 RepID=UPI0018853636|nr:probable tRNA methyltransferase 9B [Pollicipes pollicipes]